MLGTKKPTEYGTKTIDIDSAIQAFRPVLRRHLAQSVESFVSLEGTKLHPGLLEFFTHSTKKRMSKIDSDIIGQNSKCSSEPVYITETEEETYQHKLSKAELYGKIKTFISFLTSDNLLRVHYSQVLESLEVQNANKAAYANLYFELKDLLVADTD